MNASGLVRRREGSVFLTYRELAEELPAYIADLGFTHVEFLPPTEHRSMVRGAIRRRAYFAPTARYGTPQDFMFLIDQLHRNGIGVILDWVPSHFPATSTGWRISTARNLYEHADPRQGYHPDWSKLHLQLRPQRSPGHARQQRPVSGSTSITPTACAWTPVASMLYLDYGRQGGDWVPNRYGGRENLEAIEFLRHLNESVYRDYPDVQTIAGGVDGVADGFRARIRRRLGFGLKWNMGWMHDTPHLHARDPLYPPPPPEEITSASGTHSAKLVAAALA